MTIRKLELPVIARSAEISSYDEESDTATVCMARGAQVPRQDFWGERWIEELDMSADAIDLNRVAAGAVPFAKNHGGVFGMEIEDVMGRVLEASTDGQALTGKIKFSKRADVQPFIQDIKDGILRSVSVGYVPRTIEKVGEKDGVSIMRATKWELYELSSVAMPADPGAAFRSEPGTKDGKPRTFTCEVRGLGGATNENSSVAAQNIIANERASADDENQSQGDIPNMPTEAEKIAAEKLAQEKRDAEIKAAADAAKAEGAKLERERQAEIRKMTRAAKLGDDFAAKLIDGNVAVDAARSAVIDELATRDAATVTRSAVQSGVRVEHGGQDETENRRGAMMEAILHRGMPERYTITERGREFAGLTLLEMARESLRKRGINAGSLSVSQIATRAMETTSDFPSITENILNKSLRDAFVASPQTFAPFVRRVQNPDFKQMSRVQLGLGSSLAAVGEDGEISYGSMSDAAEKYSIQEYAKGLAISRKTIINDDLNAFVRIPAQMGIKSRSLESDLVYAVLTANAAMADSIALFHASHGNLGSAAAIGISSLAEARKLMRNQKEMDGEPLNLGMRFLVVPTSLEVIAEQYITAVQPFDSAKVNPFAAGGRTPLQIAVEPRLDAASAITWYGCASLDQCDMLELATLSGSSEPEILMEPGFDTLGMKFRVVHSVGVKAIDWRGLVKNPGA